MRSMHSAVRCADISAVIRWDGMPLIGVFSICPQKDCIFNDFAERFYLKHSDMLCPSMKAIISLCIVHALVCGTRTTE